MRVRPDLEHAPRLPFQRDYDYFAHLQEMRPVLESLKRGGRCVPLLLEKAARSLQFAAFPAARDAAISALQLSPTCVEGHWLRALACLGLCLNRLGVLARSPAIWPSDLPMDLVSTEAHVHLDEARNSLGYCVELTDAGDQEAADLLDYLLKLGDTPTDATLRNWLNRLLD